MQLRYKGKPLRSLNIIRDNPPQVCFCRFVCVGQPMDARECSIHGVREYTCDQCDCEDYRPKLIRIHPTHWPLCVCGHIAQEHN
jgi:hypothetical protein